MRVAVVDPSRTVAKCLSRLLKPHNHEVVPFADGPEALDCIASDQSVDVLITSSQLNSMSGPKLCEKARAIAARGRPLYIVLMSSTEDRDSLIKALDSGADDFIHKPPVAEELVARLKAADRVISMQRSLHRLATTDSLTGVLNRRAFFAKAQEACARASGGTILSAIMIDVDHFKHINDSYGHSGGDNALCALARELQNAGATVGRLGGEEFIMLVEGQALAAAVETAERLRHRLQEMRIPSGRQTIALTCSFGVSVRAPGDTIDSLLRRADVALYEAKIGGRNRVVSAGCGPVRADYGPAHSVIRSDARLNTAPAI